MKFPVFGWPIDMQPAQVMQEILSLEKNIFSYKNPIDTRSFIYDETARKG